MKKIILSLLMIVISNSYAMEAEEFYEETKGDLSVIFTYPSLGGRVLISSRSDQNGVCKAFGYERAAIGAVIYTSDYKGPLVNIDPEGKIRLGEVQTENSGLSIYRIICLNKISFSTERTILLINPSHNGSGAPYSSRSDQNGVCKSVGFGRAAVGSMMVSRTNFRGLMVIAGPEGTITGGEVATGNSGFKIDQLVCVNLLE
jgi:hypothetical protein